MFKFRNISVELMVFLLILLSFFFGFYFNEDSSGGGELDFVLHEWETFLYFKNNGILNSLSSVEYESSRTPLFLILNYFNPFYSTQLEYRFVNFIFNLTVPITLFFLLKANNFKKEIYLILSILLLSPYFRSSSFWAHQENLPILFMLLSFLILSLMHKKNLFNYKNISILAIVSSLSFYADQKYIFVSLLTYFSLLIKFNKIDKNFFIISLIYFLTSLPFLYLVFLWGNILPVESQYRLGFYPKNLVYSLSIIIFYFIPIIFFIILKKNFKNYFINLNFLDYFVLIIIILTSLLLISDYSNPWGYGVMYKFFYTLDNIVNLNTILVNLIFILYYIFGTFFIFLILKNKIINFIPIIILVILSSLIERTYQEYFDPVVILLIFIFFLFRNNFDIKNKTFIKIYLFFELIFLVIANIYYNYFNFV